ncbi:hypothetical protein [Pelagibius sp. 7325]|uniref:hypothetical protein n=1 Tax=Pelagibius sp. 7325 TaxID=3131994 RepID=UPI0030EF6BD9
MAEVTSRPVFWLIALVVALGMVASMGGAVQADDYELRNLDSARSYPPEEYRQYTEVAATQAALKGALRRLRAQGAAEGDLKVVLHLAHWVVPNGKARQVWPTADVDAMLVSPWIALMSETHADSVRLSEIHVLAFQPRLMADLYAWQHPDHFRTIGTALSSIEARCFRDAVNRYIDLASTLGSIFRYAGFYDDLICLPQPQRDPLVHFFELSPNAYRAPFDQSIYDTFKKCWAANQDFYSRLYEAIILRALKLRAAAESPGEDWWRPAADGLKMAPCSTTAL